MTIDELLATISVDAACRVRSPVGEPHLEPEHVLPPDVRRFYQLCGGVDLFPDRDYAHFILPPGEVVLANPVLVGERVADDRSDAWYLTPTTATATTSRWIVALSVTDGATTASMRPMASRARCRSSPTRLPNCSLAAMAIGEATPTGCVPILSRWAMPTTPDGSS